MSPLDVGAEFLRLLARLAYDRHVADQVEDVLLAAYKRLAGELVTGDDLTPARRARTESVLARVTSLLQEGYSQATTTLVDEMAAYSALEQRVAAADVAAIVAESADRRLTLTTELLSRQTVRSIATLPVRGLKISEWYEAQAQQMTTATRGVIQQAMLDGEGPAEIARRIYTPPSSETPSLATRARRDARTIARTTVTAVHTDASRATYQAAGAAIDRWRFRATLDTRTSDICRALDGQVFKMDDPAAPWPPRHPNCRSAPVPIPAGVAAGRLPEPTFRSYADWLASQSPSAQDRALGPARAKLFRSGRVTLRDLVTSDGRRLTLAQLATRLDVDPATIGASSRRSAA